MKKVATISLDLQGGERDRQTCAETPHLPAECCRRGPVGRDRAEAGVGRGAHQDPLPGPAGDLLGQRRARSETGGPAGHAEDGRPHRGQSAGAGPQPALPLQPGGGHAELTGPEDHRVRPAAERHAAQQALRPVQCSLQEGGGAASGTETHGPRLQHQSGGQLGQLPQHVLVLHQPETPHLQVLDHRR